MHRLYDIRSLVGGGLGGGGGGGLITADNSWSYTGYFSRYPCISSALSPNATLEGGTDGLSAPGGRAEGSGEVGRWGGGGRGGDTW